MWACASHKRMWMSLFCFVLIVHLTKFFYHFVLTVLSLHGNWTSVRKCIVYTHNAVRELNCGRRYISLIAAPVCGQFVLFFASRCAHRVSVFFADLQTYNTLYLYSFNAQYSVVHPRWRWRWHWHTHIALSKLLTMYNATVLHSLGSRFE